MKNILISCSRVLFGDLTIKWLFELFNVCQPTTSFKVLNKMATATSSFPLASPGTLPFAGLCLAEQCCSALSTLSRPLRRLTISQPLNSLIIRNKGWQSPGKYQLAPQSVIPGKHLPKFNPIKCNILFWFVVVYLFVLSRLGKKGHFLNLMKNSLSQISWLHDISP